MKVIVLSSGSKGNTTYIESGSTKILIDIGNSCKYVVSKLKEIGIEASEINAVLITHTHIDHIKGLKVFTKKYNPKVYITQGMLKELNYLTNYNIINMSDLNIGNLKINIIKTSHDAPDSVGYVVTSNKKSIVYITDTGYINNKYFDLLTNKEVYIMESNHDIEMLNNSSYPFQLRQRILGDKGHLSNYDSARYISSFIGDKTKCVMLAHLSEENNTKELAYNTLIERLEINNQQIEKIIIAKQNEETELVEVWLK